MNLWDEKAKHYARYSDKLNSIQELSFKELRKANISFKDKIIIDVGCGTGVWSLHLAKQAKHLYALDSSKAMLELLEHDAKTQGTSNITSIFSSFQDFSKNNVKSFDIAFLSMSGALENLDDYGAFLNLAKLRIYISWACERKSSLLKEVFANFAPKKKESKKDIEDFLKSEGVDFKKFVFDEKRIEKRSKQEAVQNAMWHLKMKGVNVDKEKLVLFFADENIDEISAKIKLLIF